MERKTCPIFPCTRVPAAPFAARALLGLTALVIVIGGLDFPGCQTSKPGRAPQTLDELYEYREAYRDSLITLDGSFMGWQGGECVFPPYAAPQESRSDWTFKLGNQCLYVTGGRPPDMSPMEGTGVGRQIRLDARLRITPDGRLLLEFVSCTPVSQ